MKKVLIIEDEIVLQTVYKKILSHEGFEVHTASDGLQGLDKIKEVNPDVVLLDILMPNLDGLGFLKKARVRENFPDTIVIAFSNLSDVRKLNEMLELGASRHILKASLSPKQLVDAVKQASQKVAVK